MSFGQKCYRGASPVRDKLRRYGKYGSPTCPICEQERETNLHGNVQCSGVSGVWAYTNQQLTGKTRKHILSETILIDPTDFLTKECKNCFPEAVSIAKEVTEDENERDEDRQFNFWFWSGERFRFSFQKEIGTGEEMMSEKMFKDRCVHAAWLLRVNVIAWACQKIITDISGGMRLLGVGTQPNHDSICFISCFSVISEYLLFSIFNCISVFTHTNYLTSESGFVDPFMLASSGQ